MSRFLGVKRVQRRSFEVLFVCSYWVSGRTSHVWTYLSTLCKKKIDANQQPFRASLDEAWRLLSSLFNSFISAFTVEVLDSSANLPSPHLRRIVFSLVDTTSTYVSLSWPRKKSHTACKKLLSLIQFDSLAGRSSVCFFTPRQMSANCDDNLTNCMQR